MMKRFFTLCALCLTISVAFAQPVKSITYTQEENPALYNLMLLLDVQSLHIKITGTFSGKTLRIVEHVVENGQETVMPIGDAFTNNGSTLYFSILSRWLPDDDIQILIIPGAKPDQRVTRISSTFSMKNRETYILMETFPANNVFPENDIPLIAFTHGIEISMEINDRFYQNFDQNRLRESHVSPNLWPHLFGINHFVYYTLRFE